MANKKVCDRCGKEIAPMKWFERKIFHKTTYMGRLMFSGEGPFSLEKSIELCAECNDSFIDWFNSGKGDRKIKKREEQ